MKRTVIILAAVATMLFGACRSPKPITQEQQGNHKLEIPCVNEAQDTEEYFGGLGMDENLNRQSARENALNAAKQEVKQKLGGVTKGLITDYSRYVRGNARQSDAQSIIEGEMTTVVDFALNHAKVVCREEYQTQSGSYEAHVAIQISKKELVSSMENALSENEELKALFNRDQFRKWAEEYMKNLKN